MSAGVEAITETGRIAARIDRLPLTWMQWRLALITQIFWGVIIAADGTPARLYPFTWGPEHAFGLSAFSVLLAFQFGIGILAGEYLIGLFSDRFGRRAALLVSSLVISLLLWPTALTNNFGLLLLFFALSSIGLGGVLSTNVVYMGEIIPPRERGRVMLAAQILAIVLFAVLGNVPAIFWIPSHYQWYIWLFSVVTFVVLIPLAWWGMPESPRWLEAHGHHQEAERVMRRLEAECLRRSGLKSLPEPDYARYLVPISEHVPVRELMRSKYGHRTIVMLIAWILGYSGIIYGFAGFEPAVLKAYGLSAGHTFAVILVSYVAGGIIALGLCSWIGESAERRTVIFVSVWVNVAAMIVFYFFHDLIASYILSTIIIGAAMAWLFSMYNYTATSYPTRLRATGTGMTDGVGHLGAIFGPIVCGALFAATAAQGYYGWFLYAMVPGALIPAAIVFWLGINQREAILEEVSK